MKILKIALRVSNFIFYVFFVFTIFYYAKYFLNRETPGANEFLAGVSILILISFWPALISTIIAVFSRQNISKTEFYLSIATMLFCLLVFASMWL